MSGNEKGNTKHYNEKRTLNVIWYGKFKNKENYFYILVLKM